MSRFSLRLLLAILFAVVVAASASPAVAQTQTGTITGIVTDEQGAVLPGVTVTLESPAIIRTQSMLTNERGGYSFIALPPGVYTLKFDLAGFASLARHDIRVNVAVVTSVDQVMKVAAVSETVQVVGQNSISTTRTGSSGGRRPTWFRRKPPGGRSSRPISRRSSGRRS